MAACPVGAIAPDGHFDFSACYTHNYREFLGGFADWVEQVADSKDALDYRRRVERLGDRPRCGRASPFGPELQGGVLPGGLPGGRGRDRPVPGRPQGRSSRRSSTRCRRRRRRSTSSPARTPRPTWRGGSRTRRPRRVGSGLRPRSIRSLPVRPCRTSSSGTPRRGWTPRTTSRSPGRSPPRRRS